GHRENRCTALCSAPPRFSASLRVFGQTTLLEESFIGFIVLYTHTHTHTYTIERESARERGREREKERERENRECVCVTLTVTCALAALVCVHHTSHSPNVLLTLCWGYLLKLS